MKMIRSRSASEDNSIDVGDDGTSSLSSSESLRRPSFRRHFFLLQYFAAFFSTKRLACVRGCIVVALYSTVSLTVGPHADRRPIPVP